MSQWLEEKYIALVSPQLSHFRKQSRHTFTFRCDFCGDSKRKANKTRGYLFLHHNHYFYKCHNCNVSMSLRTFLRQQAPELYREYQLDVLRQERPVISTNITPLPVTPAVATPITLPSIASLPEEHIAVQYCRGRGLPVAALDHLYFSDTWTTWLKELSWSYALPEDHGPRLILPWFNRQHELLGAQARRIDATGNAARYITVKREGCEDKIYGWDRVEWHKPIYVVEGPLDSWFLPNAVASMDSDLLRLHDKYLHTYTATYVWDNEPRNEAIVKNMSRAIKAGLSVVIWPQGLQEKDLNDMAHAGHSVVDIVQQYTFQGLRAELEYQQWIRLK